jgi:hypothetical protein
LALPQYLLYQKGGTIHIDVPSLPTAATVRIIDGGDTEQMGHLAVNVSTINTTLAANAYACNSQITVAANTGLSAGKTFWLQDDPEEALVRSVEGTTIKLRRPLFYDHVSGAAVEGARIALNVPDNYSNALWWDGRCEWNIDDTYYYTAVDCVRYPLQRLASAQDLADDEPKIADMIDSGVDVERWLDSAHELVLGEIAKRAPDQRARVFTGSMEFRSVTAAAAMYLHYLRRRDASDERETWLKEIERRLGAVVALVPRDADQDGAIEPDERMSTRSVLLVR